MRFYSGDRAGGTHHHDVALVENPDQPAPPAERRIFGMPCAVNRIAIALPSREAWLDQLAFLQACGVTLWRRSTRCLSAEVRRHPND